jgi:haloacetate dehalogenase
MFSGNGALNPADGAAVFDGFEEFDIRTSATTIHGRRGGAGPPILLLHGIPETHLMWHAVAAALASRFTVVATDLRGYGDSGKPPSAADHAPYSMRETARDQVEVMRSLGYDTFGVAGHDRGARCAYRLALDHPGAVTRLVVLDILPTGDVFGAADMRFSLDFWVWSFLAAPYPVPEQLIAGSPGTLVNHMLDSWAARPDAIPAAIRAEYVRTFADPDTVHAICEEYRAAATLDFQHDEADRGNRKIACPVLVMWSQDGPLGSGPDPLVAWTAWADDVRGGPVGVGHFIPEEAPEETARQFGAFFR